MTPWGLVGHGRAAAPHLGSRQTGDVQIPETHYAKTEDGLHLAYQSFGQGPSVVFIPPLVSNVEIAWELEIYRQALEYIARSIRIVQFDKRGIGGSDRFDEIPTLEQRIGDIAAVMDAAELESATVLGASEGGLMAQLFTARHPERVDRLVTVNSVLGRSQYSEAGAFWREGDPAPGSFEAKRRQFDQLMVTWGTDGKYFVEMFNPSRSGNEGYEQGAARFQRQCGSPADMRRQTESLFGIEGVDHDEIRCPTLVQVATGDRVIPSFASRWLASRIDGATLHEVDSADHAVWTGDQWRVFADRMLEFVLGSSVTVTTTRRFATILFTDLVDSTARTASAGDKEWHEIRASHDRVARKVVEGAGGTVVKSTGDGVLATFDVPSAALSAAVALRGELVGLGLPIRAGIHAGEVEVLDDGDVSGVAVNLASRIEGAADDGEILVSSTVRDLSMGSGWTFTERGDFALKGFDGAWRLYALAS